MTSNGKQFTVIRKMLTAVARDHSVQLKVAWCCHWNLSAFSKSAFVLFYYKANQLWLTPWETVNLVSLESQCSSRDQSLSVFVIYLDLTTKWALWLVHSWSRAPDQIQMYPDRDTIAQLLPTRRLCLFVFAIRLFKYITKHLMFGPFVSGNIRTLGKTKLTVSPGTIH